MRRLRRKRVWIPLSLAAFYLLFGAIAVGPIARWQLLKRLPPLLHRAVAIDSIRFNPVTLAVRVRGLAVTERDGSPLFAFDELLVDAAGTDLVRGIIGFDEIRLVRPVVGLGLLKDGSLSIADLLPPKPDPAATPPAEPQKPRVVRVAHLSIAEGEVRFFDLSRPEPFRAELKPLVLELSGFTTEAGKDSPYTFNARLGDTRLGWKGDFSASPLHSKGELLVDGLDLASFEPYLAGATQLRLTGGKATITSRYALDSAAAGVGLVLEGTKVALAGLSVSAPRDPAPRIQIETIEVAAERIDTLKKTVALAAIHLAGGAVTARRLPGGALELAELAGPPGRRSPQAPAAAPAPSPSQSPATGPWRVTLPSFALERFSVRWDDRALETPATLALDDLAIELRDLALPLAKPFAVRVSSKVEGGELSASGPVSVEPLRATLAVQTQALPLPAFWPYAAASVVNATLAAGLLDLKSTISLAGEDVSADADVEVSGLRLDDAAGAALVAFDRLLLEKLKYAKRPGSADLGTVALSKARLRLELDEKGNSNLGKLLRPAPEAPQLGPAPTAAEAAPERPFAVRVGLVRLEELRIDVLDRRVAPPAALSLQRITGRVQNLTSPKPSTARMDLTARVDGAPLALAGAVRPAGKDSFADVKVTLNGYDLPLSSPYAVKYVAQPIQTGKLSLDLQWRVQARQLDGKNRLKVDQLDFGDAVAAPGPEATKLPLGLAVAILSDRSGLIDLDLPVKGDLSDPQFGWTSVVVSALKNILAKVATAPFSLLAGLVSGDPESLKSIAFAPGETEPLPAEQGKLASLGKVLADRPRLRLEMTPSVDPAADGEALARAELKARIARGLDGGAVDEARWQSWVKQAFQAGRDGGAPDASFEQEEQAVLAKNPVPAERLEALRRERAISVQAALTADGGAPMERVYLAGGEGAADGGRPEVSLELK